jgi:peptide/nickel transport system ATP-binding protein
VSVQAQVLNLLQELQSELGLTLIFVAHDLSVVEHISDRIAVMYVGKIVEMAETNELLRNPQHPYTEALLSAIPVPRIHNRNVRIMLKGELTSPINPEPVCRFAERCNQCMDICTKEEPPLIEARPNHFVACHLHKPMVS